MNLSVLIPAGAATETDPWRRNALAWLTARYAALLPDAELIFGTSTETPFNRSQALNGAFRRSGGDVLLVADADVVFNVDQIESGLALLEGGAPWVICYDQERYYALTAEPTESVLAQSPSAVISEPQPGEWEQKLTSWSGLLLVARSSWEKVCGWDERFTGWGYEDRAFQFALDHRVGLHHRVISYVVHLYHERSHEENFGQPHIGQNAALCRMYEMGVLP